MKIKPLFREMKLADRCRIYQMADKGYGFKTKIPSIQSYYPLWLSGASYSFQEPGLKIIITIRAGQETIG
jgi:hypothetical protein